MGFSLATVKSLLRSGISLALYAMGLPLVLTRGKVAILMYHRVLEPEETAGVQPGMYVTTETFRKHMRFLSAHFKVISFQELLERLKTKSFKDAARYCVITFDDGWRDNYDHAYPVLREYGFPATIFLATAYVGTSKWFWPERLAYLLKDLDSAGQAGYFCETLSGLMQKYGISCQRQGAWGEQADRIIEMLKARPPEEIISLLAGLEDLLRKECPAKRLLLSWAEVEEMSRCGVSFGSHTANHRILDGLSDHEIRTELEVSKSELLRRDINFVPVFCYPNGNYNPRVVRLVKEAGYEAAVNTRPGFLRAGADDLHTLNRIGVHNDISSTTSTFAFLISGILRS